MVELSLRHGKILNEQRQVFHLNFVSYGNPENPENPENPVTCICDVTSHKKCYPN